MHRLIAESSVLQILICCFSIFSAQIVIKIGGCRFLDLQKTVSLICLLLRFFGILNLRQFHSGSVSQKFQSLSKRKIFIFHNECKNIAACPTAKAIIHLLSRAYREGRRLLIVKRTQAKIRTAFSLQFHILGNDIHNIIFHPYLFNNIITVPHVYLIPALSMYNSINLPGFWNK